MLPVTEPLPTIGASERGRPLLVPILCGFIVAASWVAGCVAIVLPY